MANDPKKIPLSFDDKLLLFLACHWRGVLVVVVPLLGLFLLLPFPGEKHMWVAYALAVMGLFWMTECLPLPIIGFIPIVLFPIRGVTTTSDCCKSYINDSIILFLGSMFLAGSVEQSGYHRRLAYFAIQTIGYSHLKILLAMCTVTTFTSMWITNTAATSMMTPINFALLRVFEERKILTIYEIDSTGEKVASDITCCYFCAATFSATIGGIGTLVGTATNLVFKGLFVEYYKEAPDYLSFPMFSAFSIPMMILLEIALFFWLIFAYLGFLRPDSDEAKKSAITEEAKKAAEKTVELYVKAQGWITYWEMSVVILFGGAMILFFCRSPQIFPGWGDMLNDYFGMDDPKYIRDSALAMLLSSLMCLLPSTLDFFENICGTFVEDLPKTAIPSVLDWNTLNRAMPYSFMFLLGGGFALSNAAKETGLNGKLGEFMSQFDSVATPVVLLFIVTFVIGITNFCSNVAVANVMVPIAMDTAVKMNTNPLWFCIAAGFSASFCFMLPVGTPGNLIVQGAARIPTKKMMVAGSGITFLAIIITWLCIYFYAPVIWPSLHELPAWAGPPAE